MVVGVVLAGGASQRMGRDKALIPLGGVALAELAALKLEPLCDELLVADGGRELLPGRRSVADGAGRGPAAGILGAAAVRPDDDLLVLACDIPLVPGDLLAHLAGERDRADWIVPGRADRLEPLCALYRPRAVAALARQVAGGELGPHRLIGRDDLSTLRLGEAQLETFGDPATMFANLNRPEDLERLVGQFG